MSQVAGTITRLLHAWQSGNQNAANDLFRLIYVELHKLAATCMHHEHARHTFRPTELISEAYLRLVEGKPLALSNRVHFFAIATKVMRRILVDSARHRCASKRGHGKQPVTLDETFAVADRPEELVALDDALIKLSKIDERKARAIELYYYGGFTQNEIALELNVHINTVARDLRLGQAWLQTYLAAERASQTMVSDMPSLPVPSG